MQCGMTVWIAIELDWIGLDWKILLFLMQYIMTGIQIDGLGWANCF